MGRTRISEMRPTSCSSTSNVVPAGLEEEGEAPHAFLEGVAPGSVPRRSIPFLPLDSSNLHV
eukprot:1364074-Pleurochrysis_carterae.AAC.1